jgi:uncharacterized protein (TIGR03437 family)
VVKLNPSGDVVYSTYLGGSREDSANAIAVDESGSAYVVGSTQSTDFPTTAGAFQTAFHLDSTGVGNQDGFVVKLNPAGSGLTAATFLGGARSDGASALALDAAGMVYVGGSTSSFDFPVKNAFQPSLYVPPGLDTIENGFFMKLDSRLSELVYSTFLSGGIPRSSGLAVDRQGRLFAVGDSGFYLPMKHAFQGTFSGCSMLALDPSGSALLFSTFLGGSRSGRALAVNDEANVYVTGGATSHFPVVGSYPVESGSLYVAKVDRGTVPAPYTSDRSIVNSANYWTLRTPVLPGTLVTIFGKNLTSASGVVAPEGYPLPTELEGTQVIYNGVPAPILAVANQNGNEQVNVQVPYGSTSWDGTPKVCCGFEIRHRGVSGYAPQPRPSINSAFVGVFSVAGRPAVQRAVDYSLVTEENPALRGEVIIVYAAGLGKVEPPVPSGMPAPASPLSSTACPYSATFTLFAIRANALFAGLVPGLVGVYQVNIRIPDDLPAGSTMLALGSEPCPFASSLPVYIPVR